MMVASPVKANVAPQLPPSQCASPYLAVQPSPRGILIPRVAGVVVRRAKISGNIFIIFIISWASRPADDTPRSRIPSPSSVAKK